ncbi:MAG: hypothetical protein K5790_10410 [Nitrosopumilus sp.]|uniref:hypothetical protein n=1 Tax=Nitrosopumilus sp. TaxID=2024843 RepID=UPI00247DB6D3|nr:hypothetical protein [Nitrosopumilus sp.]MCV0393682.1 hypothetical protein [Nitrosopumilus sp.]
MVKGFSKENNKGGHDFIPTEKPSKISSDSINTSTDVEVGTGFMQRGSKKLETSSREFPVEDVFPKKEVKKIGNEPVVASVKDFDYNGRSQAVTLNVELREKDHPQKGIDGKEYKNPLELGISGGIWNSNHSDITTGGQIQDTLREQFEKGNIKVNGISDEEFRKLLDVWDRWHLNDLNAGTKKQESIIDEHINDSKYAHLDEFYDRKVQILKDNDAYVDNGYQWGSAWLYEPLPDDIIDFVKHIQKRLQ